MLSFLLKALILVSLAILVRGTLPRYRVDQLLSLNWKLLVILYVIFFVQIILSVYIYF